MLNGGSRPPRPAHLDLKWRGRRVLGNSVGERCRFCRHVGERNDVEYRQDLAPDWVAAEATTSKNMPVESRGAKDGERQEGALFYALFLPTSPQSAPEQYKR